MFVGVTLRVLFAGVLAAAPEDPSREAWLQFKFDARHSGDASERRVETPLGLIGAVPFSDSIFTAPVSGSTSTSQT